MHPPLEVVVFVQYAQRNLLNKEVFCFKGENMSVTIERNIEAIIAEKIAAAEVKARKPLSEEARERIAAQIRSGVERPRADSADKVIRQKALELRDALEQFSGAINNSEEVLVNAVVELIMARQPVPIIGFRGFGGKVAPDDYDSAYIDRLNLLRDAVSAHHEPGVTMRIILADIHGVFNGFLSTNENGQVHLPAYLVEIQESLHAQGVATKPLSEFYTAYRLTLPQSLTDVSQQAAYVFAKNREQFIESSGKHNKRGLDPEIAARLYVQMRWQEIPMLKAEARGGLTICKGSKSLGNEFHPMPTVFLNGQTPWFTNDTAMKGGETI